MLFVPLLLASLVMFLYPMAVPVIGVAVISWLYLTFGGQTIGSGHRLGIRQQLAYRVLSVKMMAFNGEIDDDTLDVHATVVVDNYTNSRLRGMLRDAAGASTDDWKASARVIYTIFRKENHELLKRMDELILQLTAQPNSRADIKGNRYLSQEVQTRLMEIARIWKIGPNQMKTLLGEHRVPQLVA